MAAKKPNSGNLIVKWDLKDNPYAKNLETLYISSENIRTFHVITDYIGIIECLKDAWERLDPEHYDIPEQTRFYCVATEPNHNKNANLTTSDRIHLIKMVSLKA